MNRLKEPTANLEQEKANENKHVLDAVLKAFAEHARKRDLKEGDYLDGGELWETFPKVMQRLILNFNHIPDQTRPAVLKQLRMILKKDMEEGRRNLIKLFKV